MAVVLTRASCRTTVIESTRTAPPRAAQRVGENLAQIGREANLPRLAVAASLDQVDWASVDLVIECIPERLDIKQALFADLARRAARRHPGQQQLQLPDQRHRPGDWTRAMLSLHFFMPAHLVPLVEVVMADTSDEASADALIAFMKRCGSVPVKVRQDLPGFLANRLHLIDRGIASPETWTRRCASASASASWRPARSCSATMPVSKCTRPPAPPCTPRSQRGPPARCLAERAADGRHGMKTGEGFYAWTPETIAAERARYDRCAPAWT